MSDLFDKFVFDLQRFDTVQFSQIGESSTDQYNWANSQKPLLVFGGESTSTLEVSLTQGAAGSAATISELTAVTLDGSKVGYKIDSIGHALSGEDYDDQSVNVYYAIASGSLALGDEDSGVYYFEAPDNSAYFKVNNDLSATFDFTATGAGLKSGDNGLDGQTLTYNNSGASFGDFYMTGIDAWLRRTGQTEFTASGLSYDESSPGMVSFGDKMFQVTEGSGSAAVVFSVDDNGPLTFTKATVDDETAVEIGGMSEAAININGGEVQVNTSSFVFTRVGGGSGAIDLTGLTDTPEDGIKVSQTGKAEKVIIGTLSDAGVTIGETEFTVNSSGSFFFEVAKNAATGVSGIDADGEKITGAFFKGGSSFTFNGESVGFTAKDGSHDYTFSLNTLSGLVSGDAITNAGSISTFITNEITDSATFGVLSAAMSFAGTDSDGVTFHFTDAESFAGVSGLNEGLSVEGDFTSGNILVNGKGLSTTDTNLILFGMGASNADATGIGKIAGFTGGDSSAPNSITNAGGASSIFTDGDGYFLVGTQSFGTTGDTEIEFVMQGGESTTVLGISGFGGGDVDATLTGALSTVWINEASKSLSVAGDADNDFTYMYRAASGSYVLGGVSGDNVTINGIAGANIVQVTGSGSYAFQLDGGLSATFEVALGGSDTNGVEFLFDNSGKLLGISSVDEGSEVIGNFGGSAIAIYGVNGTDGDLKTKVQVDGDSSVGVLHDAFNLTKLSDGAYIVQAEGISYAYTDNLTANSSLSVKDASGDVFTIKTTADGASVVFLLDNAEIIGVSSLGAGVTLEGGLSVLTSINGETFNITGDSSFGVVGSEGASGIGVIFGLGGESVTINYAGGASQIITDKDGSFFFADNESGIEISGDSSVTFGLSEGMNAYVTSIDGLSGTAEADNSLFASLTVNGQSIAITGDEDNLMVGGNSTATGIDFIDLVGGDSVVISNAGGASQIFTDKYGTFTFASASQVVTIGGDSEVSFLMDTAQDAAITGIDSLDADGYADASADLFVGGSAITVNGQSVLITDDDSFRLYGTAGYSGVGMIDNLSDSAIVSATGGASIARTDTIGTFTFGSTSFKLEGTDNVVDFALSAPTTDVLGVKGFGSLSDGTKVDAKITGALSGIYINDEATMINVTGDADERFSYAVDAEGVATLGGVSGNGTDVVEINGAASATYIEVTGGGSYQFFNENNVFTVGLSSSDNDGLVFQVDSANAVVGISSFTEGDTVSGNFAAGVLINGSQSVQILGDSFVTLFYDDIIIRDLTTNATISVADNITEAWTDVIGAGSSFEVMDASGNTFTVSAETGGTSVMFVLDGNANIVGVSALAADMTLIGSSGAFDEDGFMVNGLSVVVTGDPDVVGVVGSGASGITSIIKLSNGANVEQAGGASDAFTDSDGMFTFTNTPSGITISGDSEVQFIFKKGANVDKADVGGISQFEGWLTAGASFFENFTVNGHSINIVNDADDLAVLGISGGIGAISKVGAEDFDIVQVIDAGGASQITTDKEGGFSFAASEQLFRVYGDSSVTFGLSSDEVTEINDFALDSESSAVVLGPLNGVVINGSLSFDVAVNGSTSGVGLAYGPYNGDNYLATYDTAAGASVVVTNAGGASYFATSNTGDFTFAGNSGTFNVAGDSYVVFELSESNPAKATGVNYLGISGASPYDSENVAATITGQLAGFTINNSSDSIAVEGDEDKIFSFAVDNSGIGFGSHATLGGVSGSGLIEINGTGGASVVEITGGASYQFYGDKTFTYESASGTFSKDGFAQFLLNGQTVGAINSFDTDDTVTGDFSDKIEFNPISGSVSGTVRVTGDDDGIKVTNDGEALIIYDLDDGAVFGESAVIGVKEAWTDVMASGDSIAVTDAVGKSFKVSGEDADGVQFLVDKETGAINGVSSLGDGVTLEGALYALSSINGKTFDIQGDSSFGVVGSSGAGIGEIFDLGGDSVLINDAGGATKITTNEDGTFYFADNAPVSLSGVKIEDDNSVVFGLSTGSNAYVTSIEGLSGTATADNGLFTSLTVNGISVAITGDEDNMAIKGNSSENGIEAISLVGGSAVVVNGAGSAASIFTDKDGTFTFASASQVVTISGDSSVVFGMDTAQAAAISAINALGASGYAEMENTFFLGESAITVNGKVVDIENDEGTLRLWGKDGHSGITMVDMVGGASTVTVNDVAGATTVRTNKDGDFYFATKDQSFYVEDTNDAVTDFIMDASQSAVVIGIEGLSEGKIIFNTATSALNVNTVQYPAQKMTFGTDSSVTLTVDPYQVVEVSGITAGGYVSGVVGNGDAATVWAEGPVTVNGKYIDITDDDGDYGIIVRSDSASTAGTPEEAFNVTGDATVNVDNFTVTADGNGEFTIGGESFTFDDAEKAFKFTTGDAKELNSVSALNGTLVDHDGNVDLDGFNGDSAIKVSNDEEVTLGGDGNYLTSIAELNDGAVVGGDLDHASVAVATNDDTVAVTVNDNPYTFIGDEDGVTIIGANDKGIGRVVGLDEGASLKIAVAGDYSVNKVDSSDTTTVLSAKAGDIIIGSDGGTNAYIYDGSNPLIREKTPLDVVEGITGIPSGGYSSLGGPSDLTKAHEPTDVGPLNIAETNIIQGSLSAGEAATVYPYVTSRYNDTIDLDRPLEIWIDNKESPVDTNQDLDLSEKRYAKKVHLFGGTQSVEFNDEGGNLAHIESVASGHKTIDLGDGGDVVVMDEPSAVGNSVSIIGGLKNDSIFVRDSANTTVDVSAGGADKIITYANAGARVTVVGYEPSMEGGIKIDELQSTDMLTAIMGQSSGLNINFGDGVVSIEHTSYEKHSEISLGADANNATFVNLFDYENTAYPVGFTGIDGGTLDVGSTENDPLILVGNYKGNKTAGSVILGGAGPDVVLAGGMDSVDARGGNNTVILENDAEREGAVIAFTQGRTVVYGMNNTLAASTGDTIVLSANNIKNFLFDGEDVTIDGNGFYGILEDVDVVKDTSGGKFVTQYIYNSDNSTVYKAAGAVENGTIYLPKDEDLRPNAFFGKNSGIDFGDYADPQTVMIDLKGDMAESSIGGSPIYTRGITGLYGYYYDYYDNPVATKEDLIFKGSDANDTLIAGNGNTSLYGDGGKNRLQGSYDYDETLSDKEGRVTFFVIGNANGAANTISNFEYVSDNNYKDTSRVTADQIEILEEQSEVVYADVSNNDVYIEVASFGGENKESVVLQNAIDTVTGYGKDFIVSGNVAQVGKDKVLVDRFGEFYMATEKNATIDVKEEGSPVTVWLDNPETGKTFRGDFAVIDASTLTSNAQLAGLGTKENTIIGGFGNNSLWGGEGSSNDMLIGGEGKNTFFYGLGNGQDTVVANDGDEVVLGISIDDIVESQSSIGDTSLTLKLRDGGSLTVNDGGGIVDYKLTNSEGVQETYYLDSNRQFKQR